MDIPSLVIVVGITIGCLLLNRCSIPLMVKTIFSAEAGASELSLAAEGWSRARTYVMAAGWLGFLMEFIIMANLIKLPEKFNALGPGLALSLVTVFYGVVLSYVVFLPIQRRLEDRVAQHTS